MSSPDDRAYRHHCKECGDEFYSTEPLDSLCLDCMNELGFHSVDSEGDSEESDDYDFSS